MHNEKVEYVRTGRFIQARDGSVQEFKSISEAKRWSLNWQLKNGGRGLGKLRVAR